MKKIKEIKTIAFDAMFLALIFVFAYVPYLGYITIGPHKRSLPSSFG